MGPGAWPGEGGGGQPPICKHNAGWLHGLGKNYTAFEASRRDNVMYCKASSPDLQRTNGFCLKQGTGHDAS